MKRQHRVLKTRGGSAQTKREPRDLPAAPIDLARVAQATYLTVEELCAYFGFKTKNAAYRFLSKHKVPRAAGRVRRRDCDRAWEAAVDGRAKVKRHAA